MKQYGVLAGCNDFGVEGATLRGCINDLRSMYDMLATFFDYAGWEFDFLVNETNTAANQRAAIAKVIAAAQPGDIVVVHNSSHGTTIPVNGKVEHANVCYGFDWSNISTFVLGSEYQALFLAAKPGVKLYFTTDSCNSGGMLTRGLKPNSNPRKIDSRFLPQPIGVQWQLEHLKKLGVMANPRGLVGNVIDIAFASGCGPAETDYSADAGEIDPTTGQEVWFGAFTKYFTQAVLANKGDTFHQIIDVEVGALKTDQYDQVPMPYGAQIDNVYLAG